MPNEHFHIGGVRVEPSARVEAGHIQIETRQGKVLLIEISLSSLLATDPDISAISLPPRTYAMYRNMKERQLKELAAEFPD